MIACIVQAARHFGQELDLGYRDWNWGVMGDQAKPERNETSLILASDFGHDLMNAEMNYGVGGISVIPVFW